MEENSLIDQAQRTVYYADKEAKKKDDNTGIVFTIYFLNGVELK